MWCGAPACDAHARDWVAPAPRASGAVGRSAPTDRLDAINKVGLLFDYRLHLGSDDRLRPFMAALRFQPQYIGDIDQHLVETERIISRRVMTQRRGEVQVTLVQEGATKQLRARYERSRYASASAAAAAAAAAAR